MTPEAALEALKGSTVCESVMGSGARASLSLATESM